MDPFWCHFKSGSESGSYLYCQNFFFFNEVIRNLNTPYLHDLYSVFDVFLFSKQIILAFVQILLQIRTRASPSLPRVAKSWSPLSACSVHPANIITPLNWGPSVDLRPLVSEAPSVWIKIAVSGLNPRSYELEFPRVGPRELFLPSVPRDSYMSWNLETVALYLKARVCPAPT